MYMVKMVLFGNVLNGKIYETLSDAEDAVSELTEVSMRNNLDAQYNIERIDA